MKLRRMELPRVTLPEIHLLGKQLPLTAHSTAAHRAFNS